MKSIYERGSSREQKDDHHYFDYLGELQIVPVDPIVAEVSVGIDPVAASKLPNQLVYAAQMIDNRAVPTSLA